LARKFFGWALRARAAAAARFLSCTIIAGWKSNVHPLTIMSKS
jgi:hypothetical protein